MSTLSAKGMKALLIPEKPFGIRIKLEEGAYKPVREHADDAGLDLRSMDTRTLFPHSMETLRTGVHVELPPGTAGILVSKSGLNSNYGITTTGLIDEGYTGEIMVTMINNSDLHYKVLAGDKISQLVIVPVLRPELEYVDEISGGDRGNSGFGSTGR